MANAPNEFLPAHSDRTSLRRLDERHATRVVALVHCHGRFQTVRIVDFSVGGLQLQGCFGVSVGDAVVVELLSAQRLEGKVAWSIGSRLGVRFLQPMLPDDPALLVLQHAARHAPGATDHTVKQRTRDE
jgi:PilZ domain